MTKQFQAAIAATGHALYAIAQGTDKAPPILQLFVNGERGIKLGTSGKLAQYLGRALIPQEQS